MSGPTRVRACGSRGTRSRIGSLVPVGLLIGLGAVAGLAAQDARAFVPKPERALEAVAQANQTSGRTQAIQLDLVLRIGDRDAIATGQLVSHPSGLARLELRGSGGRVDRYLLSGPELLAAKDGEPLADPQPMLQPVFLLQPSSQETLRAALESFGVDSHWIGIAPCGDSDCYVFGDPELAAPEVHRIPVLQDETDALGGDPTGDGSSREEGSNDVWTAPRRGSLEFEARRESTGPVARLWVDTESLQIQRIDRTSGESMVLGPMVRFGQLMVPAWLEVLQPGRPPIHFDVKRAVRVSANPQAFNTTWLYSPVDPIDPRAAGALAPASPTSP
jgi:hypothetical protein